MKKVVLASNNKGKVRELSEMLSSLHMEVLPQASFNIEDADETGLTFVENAILKARHASAIAGLPAIADDSGLEVFALNNEPGVYSARYAGEDVTYDDNNKLLLKNMEEIVDRRARFVTTICLYRVEEEELYFEDYLYGEIAKEYKGANGFGYDPIFIPEGDTRHLAEYSLDEKNIISHRGKCVKKLINYLKSNNKVL